MITTCLKNTINKFLSYFNSKRKKADSKAIKKNLDYKEETSDDIYPLW
tara:strand:- start:459 stop:602 length:144 start_codon:yes stop_codon:yes gene_type:complete